MTHSKTEASLHESEERLRAIYEAVHDAIFVMDPIADCIVEANSKASELLGYSQQELCGMHVSAIHPEEMDLLRGVLRETVEKGVAVRTEEFSCLTRQKHRVPVEMTVSRIDHHDRPHLLVVIHDITARKRAKEELVRSLSLLRATLDSTTDGILVVDTNRKIASFNKKFVNMWGIAKTIEASQDHEQALAVVLDQLRDPEGFSKRLKELYAHPDAESFDIIEFKDGRIFERYTQPQRIEGKSVGRVWSLRDVTARKRTEQALQQAHDELEQRVEDRTRELRQKQTQLIQAEKMASLGHLVAGVAHEINTPLGALKSNLDVLTRSVHKMKDMVSAQTMPPGTREHPDLGTLISGMETLNAHNLTAIERIVATVSSLRKFARLDEAALDRVDIHEGIESTLNLVQHEFKNRIELSKDFGNIPRLTCYPNQLNQVFMNLLVNASHAIEGRGKICIRTRYEKKSIVIEIRDSGVGIPQEKLQQIFDPGYTTKGFGIGTGLGLSIVYQIIADHQGRIEVESEPAHGTTFRLILPVR